MSGSQQKHNTAPAGIAQPNTNNINIMGKLRQKIAELKKQDVSAEQLELLLAELHQLEYEVAIEQLKEMENNMTEEDREVEDELMRVEREMAGDT